MLPDLTKHIPLTTIIVSYFFVCGGLYLIGFWSTFNVDIANLVSLTDIPKSFIFPFVISQGYFFFTMIINLITANYWRDDEESIQSAIKKPLWKRVIGFLTSLNFIIGITSLFIVYYHKRFKLNPDYWSLSGVVLLILLTFKFTNSSKLKQLIPYRMLRTYIIQTAISAPLLSFTIGKTNSLNTFNNHKIRYIKIIGPNNANESEKTSLKFVGFLGDKLIASSLDNKTIVFINQSSFDQVNLYDVK